MTSDAKIILREAAGLGIKIATDGSELFMLAPLRVPRAVRRQFEAALNELRTEVIAIIQNGGGS
jgi:hypothetical protein